MKASVSEGVGMIVDFAGRSLLVALLGPAGLPGLAAALGAYTAGMLLREGLLGVEYQLVSKENLSTLVAEVATFGFDELKIEAVIKEAIPAGAAKGRIFGAQGMTEAQAKFAQDYVKTSGAKLFEKTFQNAVEGKALPAPGELVARAAHALAVAGLKGLSDKLLTSPTVYTASAERFRKNLQKIILNGPPPKAAFGYAMTKELTDMLAAPDWANTTFEQKIARLTKTGLISVASAVPVSAAFTHLGAKDATRAKKLAATHPDVFYARLREDPLLADAYAQYRSSVKGLPGVRERSFAQWIAGHQGPELGTGKVPHLANAGTPTAQHGEVNVEKAASAVMKEMDQVMTPQ